MAKEQKLLERVLISCFAGRSNDFTPFAWRASSAFISSITSISLDNGGYVVCVCVGGISNSLRSVLQFFIFLLENLFTVHIQDDF